jgi:hypothetical protein
MDGETMAMIAKAFGELTLTGFLFANWWLERSERLRVQASLEAHYRGDIEQLLDQTEQLKKA